VPCLGPAAFYQASGAYGFRDQLQDCMALATIRPSITREAPPQSRQSPVRPKAMSSTGGCRTRAKGYARGFRTIACWLAYATAHYVKVTGDAAVLDETAPFLTGRALDPGESDSFFQPTVADEAGSLYEHCVRALDASLALGGHDLPLIGSGDWSDGMNRVGEGGKGESVWLGWLLHAALDAFAGIADTRGDQAHAAKWRAHMQTLSNAFEHQAWDGQWYRRGWFDDGSPLGLGNERGVPHRIPSAQSWAVISGAAPPKRAAQAMAAVERELILPHDGLALLFTPPFDRSALDPGYIKGYPPGVRENGGQYNHAALWSVMAFAELGEGDKAAALFWMLNPITARARAATYTVTRWSPTCRGRCLRRSGSRRARRLDLVHGLGGLDATRWCREHPWTSHRGWRLRLEPCIPRSWPRFQIMLRHGASRYEIVVENPQGVQRGVAAAELDGATITVRPLTVPLKDDRAVHRLQVRLG